MILSSLQNSATNIAKVIYILKNVYFPGSLKNNNELDVGAEDSGNETQGKRYTGPVSVIPPVNQSLW